MPSFLPIAFLYHSYLEHLLFCHNLQSFLFIFISTIIKFLVNGILTYYSISTYAIFPGRVIQTQCLRVAVFVVQFLVELNPNRIQTIMQEVFIISFSDLVQIIMKFEPPFFQLHIQFFIYLFFILTHREHWAQGVLTS